MVCGPVGPSWGDGLEGEGAHGKFIRMPRKPRLRDYHTAQEIDSGNRLLFARCSRSVFYKADGPRIISPNVSGQQRECREQPGRSITESTRARAKAAAMES
jgi:hypothetical protein